MFFRFVGDCSFYRTFNSTNRQAQDRELRILKMVESDEEFAPQEFPHTETDVIIDERDNVNEGYL